MKDPKKQKQIREAFREMKRVHRAAFEAIAEQGIKHYKEKPPYKIFGLNLPTSN